MRTHGDTVPFHETIVDVYRHLIDSRCSTTLIVPEENSYEIVPSVHYGSKPRPVCEVCDKTHEAEDCHLRDAAFMPPSLARKVIRYNQIHGSIPKVPKKDKLQVPFKPRHFKPKPTANMASASLQNNEVTPIVAPANHPPMEIVNLPIPSSNDDHNDEIPTPIDIDQTTHAIKPSAGLAEYANVSKDYLDFIISEPVPTHQHNYHLTALMTNTEPEHDSVFISSEHDIIFFHRLLQHHKSMDNEFQWCFPCTTKSTPLELFRFLIKYLTNQGIIILQIRIDENGSLANSSEFCKLLFSVGITLQNNRRILK